MPGMMRSRITGCQCLDCAGGWCADRASEKRDWWREVLEEADLTITRRCWPE